MPAETTQAAIGAADLKFLGWVASSIIGALSAGATAAWWFSRQQSNTKREMYSKIGYVERDAKASLEKAHNECMDKLNTAAKECQQTKERLGLVEKDAEYQGKQIEALNTKLMGIQKDIADIKDAQRLSDQKSSENHLTIIGEVRAIGDKMTIAKLVESQRK